MSSLSASICRVCTRTLVWFRMGQSRSRTDMQRKIKPEPRHRHPLRPRPLVSVTGTTSSRLLLLGFRTISPSRSARRSITFCIRIFSRLSGSFLVLPMRERKSLVTSSSRIRPGRIRLHRHHSASTERIMAKATILPCKASGTLALSGGGGTWVGSWMILLFGPGAGRRRSWLQLGNLGSENQA